VPTTSASRSARPKHPRCSRWRHEIYALGTIYFFCCGSNSVTRRAALRAIGDALPTESLAEDQLLAAVKTRGLLRGCGGGCRGMVVVGCRCGIGVGGRRIDFGKLSVEAVDVAAILADAFAQFLFALHCFEQKRSEAALVDEPLRRMLRASDFTLSCEESYVILRAPRDFCRVVRRNHALAGDDDALSRRDAGVRLIEREVVEKRLFR
jgi:hypothetical protein